MWSPKEGTPFLTSFSQPAPVQCLPQAGPQAPQDRGVGGEGRTNGERAGGAREGSRKGAGLTANKQLMPLYAPHPLLSLGVGKNKTTIQWLWGLSGSQKTWTAVDEGVLQAERDPQRGGWFIIWGNEGPRLSGKPRMGKRAVVPAFLLPFIDSRASLHHLCDPDGLSLCPWNWRLSVNSPEATQLGGDRDSRALAADIMFPLSAKSSDGRLEVQVP